MTLKTLLKKISLLLISSLLCNDVVSADPEIMRRTETSHTLSAPTIFQKGDTASGEKMLEALFIGFYKTFGYGMRDFEFDINPSIAGHEFTIFFDRKTGDDTAISVPCVLNLGDDPVLYFARVDFTTGKISIVSPSDNVRDENDQVNERKPAAETVTETPPPSQIQDTGDKETRKTAPGILKAAKIYINEAAAGLKLHPLLKWLILRPKRITSFELSVKLDSGDNMKFWAFRVLENDSRGAGKGGIRWLVGAGESPEEAKKTAVGLATLMSIKNAVVGIPYGGGKGDVLVDNRPLTENDKARKFRAFARALTLKKAVGTYIDVPAPDKGTDARMMNWFLDEHLRVLIEKRTLSDKQLLAALKNVPPSEDPQETPILDKCVDILAADKDGHILCPELGAITGKIVGKGGSKGRTKATGFGGYLAFLETHNHFKKEPGHSVFTSVSEKTRQTLGKDIKDMTIGISGSGNVGEYNAWAFAAAGARVTLLQDISGTIYDPNGIDLKLLDKCLERLPDGRWANLDTAKKDLFERSSAQFIKDPDFFWRTRTNVKVPAATENQITESNADFTSCDIILELANNPTSPKSDKILKDKGILIIPDVLANVGGVTVSYFEWLQNIEGRYWDRISVDKMLGERISSEVDTIFQIADRNNVDMRQAAFMLSLARMAEAEIARSWFLRLFFRIFTPYEGYVPEPETVEELSYTIKRGQLPGLIRRSEDRQTKEIKDISKNALSKFTVTGGYVLISGPVTSGKMALSERVKTELALAGKRVTAIDIDAEIAKAGVDAGTADSFLYNKVFKNILSDIKHKRLEDPDQIYIIEGGRELLSNAVLKKRGILSEENVYSIFVNTAPSMKLAGNKPLTSLDLRLIRHILTFSGTFGKDPIDIIRSWPAMRKKDLVHVYPSWHNADVTFNSYMHYEISALKPHAVELLKGALNKAKKLRDDKSIRVIKRLLSAFDGVPAINDTFLIPRNSIIRQYINNSPVFKKAKSVILNSFLIPLPVFGWNAIKAAPSLSNRQYELAPRLKTFLSRIAKESCVFVDSNVTALQDMKLSVLCTGYAVEFARRVQKYGIKARVARNFNQSFIHLPDLRIIVDVVPSYGTWDMKNYARTNGVEFIIIDDRSPDAAFLYEDFFYMDDGDPYFNEEQSLAVRFAESVEAKELSLRRARITDRIGGILTLTVIPFAMGAMKFIFGKSEDTVNTPPVKNFLMNYFPDLTLEGVLLTAVVIGLFWGFIYYASTKVRQILNNNVIPYDKKKALVKLMNPNALGPFFTLSVINGLNDIRARGGDYRELSFEIAAMILVSPEAMKGAISDFSSNAHKYRDYKKIAAVFGGALIIAGHFRRGGNKSIWDLFDSYDDGRIANRLAGFIMKDDNAAQSLIRAFDMSTNIPDDPFKVDIQMSLLNAIEGVNFSSPRSFMKAVGSLKEIARKNGFHAVVRDKLETISRNGPVGIEDISDFGEKSRALIEDFKIYAKNFDPDKVRIPDSADHWFYKIVLKDDDAVDDVLAYETLSGLHDYTGDPLSEPYTEGPADNTDNTPAASFKKMWIDYKESLEFLFSNSNSYKTALSGVKNDLDMNPEYSPFSGSDRGEENKDEIAPDAIRRNLDTAYLLLDSDPEGVIESFLPPLSGTGDNVPQNGTLEFFEIRDRTGEVKKFALHFSESSAAVTKKDSAIPMELFDALTRHEKKNLRNLRIIAQGDEYDPAEFAEWLIRNRQTEIGLGDVWEFTAKKRYELIDRIYYISGFSEPSAVIARGRKSKTDIFHKNTGKTNMTVHASPDKIYTGWYTQQPSNYENFLFAFAGDDYKKELWDLTFIHGHPKFYMDQPYEQCLLLSRQDLSSLKKKVKRYKGSRNVHYAGYGIAAYAGDNSLAVRMYIAAISGGVWYQDFFVYRNHSTGKVSVTKYGGIMKYDPDDGYYEGDGPDHLVPLLPDAPKSPESKKLDLPSGRSRKQDAKNESGELVTAGTHASDHSLGLSGSAKLKAASTNTAGRTPAAVGIEEAIETAYRTAITARQAQNSVKADQHTNTILRNISDAKMLVRNLIESILNIMTSHYKTISPAPYSEKRLVLAFSSRLAGIKDSKIRSALKDLENLKNTKGFDGLLGNFEVITSFDGPEDLSDKLSERGIVLEANPDNICFAFTPEIMEGLDPSVNTVLINELKKENGESFGELDYYPLFEIITLALIKYHSKLSAETIALMLREIGVNTESLNISSIKDTDGKINAFLICDIIPKADRYSIDRQGDRIGRIHRLINTAA